MAADRIRVAIVGSSGHAVAALDALATGSRLEMVGWLDSFRPAGEQVEGFPTLGHPDDVAQLTRLHGFDAVFLGVSHNATRRLLWEGMLQRHSRLRMEAIVHRSAVVARSASVGAGALIMPGAIVGARCRVGAGAIVNTNASVDHDSVLNEFSSVLPGVVTGGNVRLGTCSCICIGASVSHAVSIGDHTVVGAGAVVLSDLPERVVAYGTPARVVRSRSVDERHF